MLWLEPGGLTSTASSMFNLLFSLDFISNVQINIRQPMDLCSN